MIKKVKQFFFRRKLKDFFSMFCNIIDGCREQGMSTMEARAYLINLIDEMLIARANKIKDEAGAKK